nr:hypothetical protein [Haloferax larsenii]
MSDNEDGKEHDPISHNQLHEFHKDMTSDGVRVKKDATSLMQQQLQNTSRAVIQLAEKKMEARDGGQLEKQDVRAAFDEALRPYSLIDDFITIMGEYEFDLKQEASRTNVLEFDIEDDE